MSGLPPGNYQVTVIASSTLPYLPTRRLINNAGQIIVNGQSNAYLWNPISPNATVGDLTGIGALPADAPPHTVAMAINDYGQIIGTTARTDGSDTRPFLWTPSGPKSTSGTLTAFLGGLTGTPTDINSYGEIGASGLLWLPDSANAVTGTPYWNNNFQGLIRINDSGQAIMGGTLFTPTTPRGTTGTFTALNNLPSSSQTITLDINAGGSVLGSIRLPIISHYQAFLWTPTTPNGATGTVTLIPLPANILSMQPVAMNASGQIAGWIEHSNGLIAPFLYESGAVYDLSTLSDQLRSFSGDDFAIGINDLGQIVVCGTSVYLLTPGAAPSAPPGSVPVTFAAANGEAQAFTVTGAGCSPGGYNTPQTLHWIPGSSCTVAFLSPHFPSPGTRYDFIAWQDGIATNPRVFAAPVQAATYTANFSTSYLLTVLANSSAAGTVAGGGWYPSGALATVSANPAIGYRVAGFTPSATVTMTAPMTVIANFSLALPEPPGHYQITQIDLPGNSGPINNYGQVIASFAPFDSSALWTPDAPNQKTGRLTMLAGLASAINGRGQVALSGGFSSEGASLWSPDTPNATTGTAALLPAPSPGTLYRGIALSIDSFGQVSGLWNFATNGNFLWTPTQPNGTVGTISTTSPLAGSYINDFGQGIQGTTLFTPLPHAATPARRRLSPASPVPPSPRSTRSIPTARFSD